MMDSVLQDLRYALRTLQRAPLFTLVAVLTLGLGIGATTVVFTILNGVVLRPLQYEASDRLFGIWEQNEQGNYRLGSYPAFRDWRAQSDVFEALAYIRGSSDLMPGHDGARRVGAAFVSDEFFEVLRGQPLIGRLFSPDEQRPGGAPVAVLTHALWREAFGGDRRVIGSTIRLNAATYTVVGVLPDWFQFPSWAGVYLPLSTILPTDRILAQRGFHADSRIVAKLKPAVSIKQAQAAMAAIQSRLATAYPADNRGWTRVEFVSLFEEELRFGAVRPVLVFHGADFSSGHSGDRHRASRASANAGSFPAAKGGVTGHRGFGTLAAAAVFTGGVRSCAGAGAADRDGSPGAQPVDTEPCQSWIRPAGRRHIRSFSAAAV